MQERLRDIVGQEVSAISFVRDYVEILFDGPILRLLSDPIITLGAAEYRFPSNGSRDALCSFIGAEVTGAFDRAGQLVFVFTGRGTIAISKASTNAGPEIAHFVPTRRGVLALDSMIIWENELQD